MATPRAFNARLNKFVEFPDAPLIGSFAITLPLEPAKGFEDFKVLTVQPCGLVAAMCANETELRALAVELNKLPIPWAQFSTAEDFGRWKDQSEGNQKLHDTAKNMCRAVDGYDR